MSKIEVDTIAPQSGTTVTLGESGDTVNIPSGVTITNNGTQTGFGRTGTVDWQSTVKTSSFTAVDGEGYFVNTTSSAITMTLPAGSSGAVISVKDYASTFDTNNLIITPNGSEKIGGSTEDVTLTQEGGIAITLIYIDSTQGWLVTSSGLQLDASRPIDVDFLIIAGGGGGAYFYGGGGGAGGYRNSYSTESSGGGGSSETSLALTPGVTYTVVIGGGGAGTPGTPGTANNGTSGSDSSLSGSGITTITSTGGGGAGGAGADGLDGGSGGGGGGSIGTGGSAGGSGTANQGFDGQTTPGDVQGTGGGAGASGASGGTGLASSITGSSVTRGQGGSAPATANTGNGGIKDGGNGQSGVLILRLATADYSGTTTGSPTVTTDGTDTIIQFNSSGSYTA
jgi:PHD/YefM family antitoxin component YafN of YafNO toxin-antitoxin module